MVDKKFEYEKLAELERETTKTRHTTFTALISISFVLPGLALNAGALSLETPLGTLTLSQVVFLLGFLFYCFAVFHYVWYHRHSHFYRGHLKALEEELGIHAYRLRRRPTLGPFEFHFVWALYILGLLYGAIAALFSGVVLFAGAVGIAVVAYFLFLLGSWRQSEEPLEG